VTQIDATQVVCARNLRERPRRRLPSLPEQYRRYALLFSLSGRWPVSRVKRLNAKAYDGCGDPPIPPQEMTDIELERIQRLLAKQGWTLVRNSEGLLVPVRTI
jgi:hypothetical protein